MFSPQQSAGQFLRFMLKLVTLDWFSGSADCLSLDVCKGFMHFPWLRSGSIVEFSMRELPPWQFLICCGSDWVCHTLQFSSCLSFHCNGFKRPLRQIGKETPKLRNQELKNQVSVFSSELLFKILNSHVLLLHMNSRKVSFRNVNCAKIKYPVSSKFRWFCVSKILQKHRIVCVILSKNCNFKINISAHKNMEEIRTKQKMLNSVTVKLTVTQST